MPGEVTALYTEIQEKLAEYYSYLSTIQSTVTNDLVVHANVIATLSGLITGLDGAIVGIKNMTS